MKKSWDAVDWKRRQLKGDMDQEKVADGKMHREELRSLLPPFSDLYGRDSSAITLLAQSRSLLAEADAKLDDMEMDGVVGEAVRQGESQLYFIAHYIQSGESDKALTQLNFVRGIVAEVNVSYPKHPDVVAFNKKLAKVEAQLPADPKLKEGEFEKLKILVAADLRQCEIAMAKRDPFLAREALSRLRTSIAPVQTGGRLAAHAEAASWLTSSTPFLSSLQTVGEQTVPEDTCSMVNAALASLAKAISKRDVRGVIKARATAMERIAELKAQLPKATESSRESSNEVLVNAEKELKTVEPMVPLIAEFECKEAEILVNASVALARVAIANSDARACIVHLQYLHSLVQPLSQIHATHPLAIKLAEVLETITKDLMSIKGVGDHDAKEVEALINDLGSEVKMADPAKPVEALALLRSKKAVAAAFQLRKRFAFVPSAKTCLQAADALHITLQGCTIPGDPCWAPIVLTDWRCAPKEFDSQDELAKRFTQFNFKWSLANSEWAKQTLDGLGYVFTRTTFGWLMDGLIKDNRDTAIGALNEIQKAAAELSALVPDSPLASFATTVEASLRRAHTDKIALWSNIFKYVSCIASSRQVMEDNDKTCRELELMKEFDRQSNGYKGVMLALREAMEALEEGSLMVPDNCVDAVALSGLIRPKLAIVEDRFRLSCLAYIKQALAEPSVEHGQMQSVDEGVIRLRTYFPQAAELKTGEELIEARKKAIIEADQKRKAEYEAAKKAEAERVQRVAAQCEAKWVAPYTGGRIEVGSHDTWTYHADTGEIKNNTPGKPTWTFKVRKGEPECTIHDAKEGWQWGFGIMKEDMSLSIYTEIHNNTWAGHHFTRCWQRYIYNESEQTYASTLGAYHKFKINPTAMNLVEGGQGDLRGDKATYSGSIPPAVILWCMVHQAFSPKWPKWIAARQEWNDLCHEEYQYASSLCYCFLLSTSHYCLFVCLQTSRRIFSFT
jgi:hypothetical protein